MERRKLLTQFIGLVGAVCGGIFWSSKGHRPRSYVTVRRRIVFPEGTSLEQFAKDRSAFVKFDVWNDMEKKLLEKGLIVYRNRRFGPGFLDIEQTFVDQAAANLWFDFVKSESRFDERGLSSKGYQVVYIL